MINLRAGELEKDLRRPAVDVGRRQRLDEGRAAAQARRASEDRASGARTGGIRGALRGKWPGW
jgi:hypothetical protein